MESQYGIIKAQPGPKYLPETDILHVNHKGKTLVTRSPAFRAGNGTYLDNLAAMQQPFYHSSEQPVMHFQPATTSESVSIASHDFAGLAKPQILDPSWLQLGWYVLAPELIFMNPPKDGRGNPITDEKALKAFLNKCTKVHGIYLGNNDFSAAPRESFRQGIQESREFAESGLARALEHVDGNSAPLLEKISSKGHYPRDVDVCGYDEVTEPILRVASLYQFHPGLRVASLYSLRSLGGRLFIVGYGQGDNRGGCAFGVSQTGEASRAQG